MRAAEDYDLWLRVLSNHEVGLLEENLVTRRAGHADQLSATVPAIDRFRILALAKLLANPELQGVRRAAAAEVLQEKCRIYANGLRRRKRDAEFFDQLAAGATSGASLARVVCLARWEPPGGGIRGRSGLEKSRWRRISNSRPDAL